MESTSRIPKSMLAGSELTEIACRFWNFVVEKLKHNATGRFWIDGNVELSNAWI